MGQLYMLNVSQACRSRRSNACLDKAQERVRVSDLGFNTGEHLRMIPVMPGDPYIERFPQDRGVVKP